MTTVELKENTPAIQAALDDALEAQTLYWNALSVLEYELDCAEADGNDDLSHMTVDRLMEQYGSESRGNSGQD